MDKFKILKLKNSMLIGSFISNFIGIQIINIMKFQTMAPSPPSVTVLTQKLDSFYMPFSFLLNLTVILIYEQPIRRYLKGQFNQPQKMTEGEHLSAQQRLLNEPFVLMGFSFAMWLLAAIVYPAVYYWNGVETWIIRRVYFQTMITGLITVICAFFIFEYILQKQLAPIFFPSGRLYATPKTIRIQIRTRLAALMLAINLIPFISVLAFISVAYTVDRPPVKMLELIRSTLLMNSFVFLGLGVWVTFLVGRNLTQPFSEIIRVLKNVHKGDLNTKVRVTTNDEIGYTGDVINEMTAGLKEREELQHSLNLAREVQQNLLPKSFPVLPGLDIAGQSIYCDQTGGDYYDFLEGDGTDAGEVGIVVGDVAGHGVSSALLMTTARAFLRIRSSMSGDIAQVVTDVNRQLSRDVGTSARFMTLFYLVLEPDLTTVRWVRAGHDPAILYNINDDTFDLLKGKGIALGVDEDSIYLENHKSGLLPGQIILIGTDGIWEARNSKGKMLGKEALYDIIRQHKDAKASEIVGYIFEALEKFQQGVPAEDDITMVVIKI